MSSSPSSTQQSVDAAPGAAPSDAARTTTNSPLPQIRHAGRAHVRGKIRRVWRPRYLELLDSGIVHYYEFPSERYKISSPTNQGNNSNTNLEDSWHCLTPSSTSWESFLWGGGGATSHETMSRTEGALQPKYVLQIVHARILDATTLRDMHVGLPRGSYGFTFRGQRLMNLESPPTEEDAVVIPRPALEPRDFLCAVSTLEDAQMWCVALQWAASERRAILERPLAVPVDEEGFEHVVPTPISTTTTTTTTTTTVVVPTNEPQEGQSQPQQEIEEVTRSLTSTPATSNTAPPVSSRGKMVVTQVTNLRIVRLSTWQWEVAYEIRGLFLSTTQSGAATAEVWTAWRTAQDVQDVVQPLPPEWKHSQANVWDSLQQLPRLASSSSSSNAAKSSLFLSPQALDQAVRKSIPTVDNILRLLVTDATVLQSPAMKQFLGVASKTQRQPPSLFGRLREMHNPQGLVERRVEPVPESVTPQVFVQQWLQRGDSAKTQSSSTTSPWDSCAAFCLQQPFWLGGVGVSSVAALWPLCKWAFSVYSQWVPTISVRTDALMITWIGAAYLGYQYHSVSTPPSSNTTVTTRLKKSACKKTTKKPKIDTRLPDSEEMEHVGTPEVSSYDEDDTGHGDLADDDDSEGEATGLTMEDEADGLLSSPLPQYPENDGKSCWKQPPHEIFHVRSVTYLKDRVKEPSGPAPLTCRGVDVWMTDNPQRHIARHPSVLGGKLGDEDTFLVNFLLPFGNFVAYFSIPPLSKFPRKLRTTWTKFLKGDQQYRDARLKLLPVVVDGPWIVKAAVGPGKSPALLGKVIPLQYFFRDADKKRKGVYEVDVIINASSIAKGILSVVKSNTKCVSIAFAFIIEAAEQDELPETVLCSCQVDSLHLEHCPMLPPHDLDTEASLEP